MPSQPLQIRSEPAGRLDASDQLLVKLEQELARSAPAPTPACFELLDEPAPYVRFVRPALSIGTGLVALAAALTLSRAFPGF
ncbi:hypothetical protein HJG44_05090 [Enterovirga sp. DB1703]|uniref:Uncharacterized protein n=1 Tax=Enterovirga aerilata TaxID=2730920 RepID=A0A849ICX6_9HYPH|nr:hypothetical protein [Enterovirga sp. DB1703]